VTGYNAKSMTDGHCDAIPMIVFPVAVYHHRLVSTNLITEVQVCEQLDQIRLKWNGSYVMH